MNIYVYYGHVYNVYCVNVYLVGNKISKQGIFGWIQVSDKLPKYRYNYTKSVNYNWHPIEKYYCLYYKMSWVIISLFYWKWTNSFHLIFWIKNISKSCRIFIIWLWIINIIFSSSFLEVLVEICFILSFNYGMAVLFINRHLNLTDMAFSLLQQLKLSQAALSESCFVVKATPVHGCH